MVLPLTFPDGTRAELVSARGVEIAGARPYTSGRLKGKSPTPGRGDLVGRDFRIFYGDLSDLLPRLNGGRPPILLGQYAGVDGQTVGFWDFQSDDDADYLGFQFGPWAVLVYDYPDGGELASAAMTDAERAAWAANFSGRETSDGFLLLEGSGPLRLARAGEHAGPELLFGTVEPSGSFVLYPGGCRPHRGQKQLVHGKLVQWSHGFADWCLSDSMRIDATGSNAFIDALLRSLSVRNVALATS